MQSLEWRQLQMQQLFKGLSEWAVSQWLQRYEFGFVCELLEQTFQFIILRSGLGEHEQLWMEMQFDILLQQRQVQQLLQPVMPQIPIPHGYMRSLERQRLQVQQLCEELSDGSVPPKLQRHEQRLLHELLEQAFQFIVLRSGLGEHEQLWLEMQFNILLQQWQM